jgi:putative transposase
MSNKKYKEEDFDKEDYKRVVNIYREILIERTGKDLTIQEIRKLLPKYKEKKVKTLAIINVPRSSFYYRSVPISDENIEKIRFIDANVKRIYDANYGNFGRERVFQITLSESLNFTREQVRVSMKRQGLVSIIRIPKRRKREDPKSPRTNLPNLLQRDFSSKEPGTKYSTDTTYLETPYTSSGFLYVCGLLDLCNFIPYGLKASEHNDLELIKSSYFAAQSHMKENAIINSDHGSAHLANYIKN